MRPSSAETSDPACVKRKMLSMKRRTSRPSSRKNSAIVRPVRPTRRRAPGGSFIWPKTMTVLSMTPDSIISCEQVVALAGALAHAREDGVAAVLLGDVADELLDDDGLADAGAAEDADLAALREGADEVDDLDAGLEDLGRGRLLLERRRGRGGSDSASRALTAPFSSIGSPRTLKTRPSVSGPTGTLIGAPRSTASVPRARPSVVLIATVRTQLLPRCCCTSQVTRVPGSLDAHGVEDRRAAAPAGNSTSTTGPVMAMTRPTVPALVSAAGVLVATAMRAGSFVLLRRCWRRSRSRSSRG